MLNETDRKFLRLAYDEAKAGCDQGDCPVGSVLARRYAAVARAQPAGPDGDPVAHGEMDCLRKAWRQRSYTDTTQYATFSPSMMCTGTNLQFKIDRIAIGKAEIFPGNIEFMRRFIQDKPGRWNEDITEN